MSKDKENGNKKIRNRQTLINDMAPKLNVSKLLCDKFIDCFIEEIKQYLQEGDKITLHNFITFDVSERDARFGRDPQSGKVIEYPPYKVITCKMSDNFKSMIKESWDDE